MNPDVRMLIADAERAAREGDLSAARRSYIEAGACASNYALWRSALRCYRYALEIDLVDEVVVASAARIAIKVGHLVGISWADYVVALKRRPWPHFGSRGAQMTLGDRGGIVQCPVLGPVLEILMSERDFVDTRPSAAVDDMPMAMALVILRRAVFAQPRDYVSEQPPMSVRVSFNGGAQFLLDDVGDWEPVRATSK